MRSQGTIRARVERKSSAWPTSTETQFFSWLHPIERCPVCACDLVTHTREAALAQAVEGRDTRDLPPPMVFFWVGELERCPRCGLTLSVDGPVTWTPPTSR